MSPSTRRAWIEIRSARRLCKQNRSPSTRRAWIEIQRLSARHGGSLVALHPEGVDRNPAGRVGNSPPEVALHPEGVDRNCYCQLIFDDARKSPSTRRAWIEIATRTGIRHPPEGSPSTRRAWIEILAQRTSEYMVPLSPSTRRAWIEMQPSSDHTHYVTSPSTRRAWIEIFSVHRDGV